MNLSSTRKARKSTPETVSDTRATTNEIVASVNANSTNLGADSEAIIANAEPIVATANEIADENGAENSATKPKSTSENSAQRQKTSHKTSEKKAAPKIKATNKSKIQTDATEAPNVRTIRRVNELLIERYGARQPLARDPLDGLILIILSQATNDINCDRAFSSLKAAFPTWDQVLKADVSEVADAIRSGGLANQKAARIKEILRQMHEESGALNLDWMHAASAEECRAYMQKFHGVGPKTIACVLVFFLAKPAFPVDTHVHRVTKRLSWIRPQASADEAHRVLETLIPDACKLDLHVNFISHGRAICRADGNGGPNCGACLIRRFCAFGKARGGENIAPKIDGARKFHGTDFFVTLESVENSS